MPSIQEIVNYAKANPDSEYAKNAFNVLQSGGFDQQAAQEGYDLTPVGRPARPSLDLPLPNFSHTGEEIGASYKSSAEDVIKQAPRIFGPSEVPDQGNFVDNFTADLGVRLGDLGHIAGDVASSTFAPVASILKAFVPKDLANDSKKAVDWVADKVTNEPHILKVATGINDWWDSLSPDVKQSLGKDLPNLISLLGAGKVGEINPEVSMAGAKDAFGNLVETAGKGANTVLDTTTGLAEKAGDTISKIPNPVEVAKKIVSKTAPKAEADILATPESELHKLTPAERDIYFKNEQTKIAQKSTALKEKVDAGLAQKTEVSTKQINDLNQEVEKTAYNKTLELKPKAIKAFGEQSKTFRELRTEDMAPYKDTPMAHSEVSDALDKTFPDNPEIAQSMKAKLGLDTKTPGWTTMTIGDLDSKMMEIKGDLSSAAKKGTRVYTPEELNTDRALQGMSNLLKEKGVDLGRSNKFWREWAPLRDKIVTKLKPFDMGGLETKTFSKILKESAGGDIHSQNFVNGIEKVLGEPITTETKTAMEKLSTAQKQQLADELDAEMQKTKIDLEKKQSLGGSKNKQLSTNLQVERAARIKTLIKTALVGAGIIAAGKSGALHLLGL